eukprot:TRINITY_DN106_c0_g1_i1.p1 TRINITY_DN106_c0_g1~~TRINITY_DN106_c0_g1_i1.p1  ORF type:complete len:290 (-),score=25.32 TRINITY_DN106_c0_g1_i1:647-1516(-)
MGCVASKTKDQRHTKKVRKQLEVDQFGLPVAPLPLADRAFISRTVAATISALRAGTLTGRRTDEPCRFIDSCNPQAATSQPGEESPRSPENPVYRRTSANALALGLQILAARNAHQSALDAHQRAESPANLEDQSPRPSQNPGLFHSSVQARDVGPHVAQDAQQTGDEPLGGVNAHTTEGDKPVHKLSRWTTLRHVHKFALFGRGCTDTEKMTCEALADLEDRSGSGAGTPRTPGSPQTPLSPNKKAWAMGVGNLAFLEGSVTGNTRSWEPCEGLTTSNGRIATVVMGS